jgi:dihydrofolate reductase
MQITTKETQLNIGQNPKKKILIYNFNAGLKPNELPGKISVPVSALDGNDNFRSLENEFQTVIMDIDNYNYLKEFSNPPFPGKQNFIITTDEVLLNNSVKGMEFAGLEDIILYMVNDKTEETVLLILDDALSPFFLKRSLAKEFSIVFDPLIIGSEAHLMPENGLNLMYNGYSKYDSGLIMLKYKVLREELTTSRYLLEA